MRPFPTAGHEDDLVELGRAWCRARYRPVTAVITGPAGTGKSRLVAMALDTLAPASRSRAAAH